MIIARQDLAATLRTFPPWTKVFLEHAGGCPNEDLDDVPTREISEARLARCTCATVVVRVEKPG